VSLSIALIQVLAVQDKSVQQLVNIVTAAGVAEAGFPVRVSLPLYLGVYATVNFENCIAGASPCADVASDVAAKGWRPAAALFAKPPADEYKWSKKTQRATAARVAASKANSTAATAGAGAATRTAAGTVGSSSSGADGCSSSAVSTADVTPTAHAAAAGNSSNDSAAARRLDAVD
jgi:GPCR-chaperone